MSGVPDELVEKAARAMFDHAAMYDSRGDLKHCRCGIQYGVQHPENTNHDAHQATAALEAVGLPALLERVEAAEREVARLKGQHRSIRDGWHDLATRRDALAAKVADAGERIAQAIEEAAPRTRPGGEWDSNRTVAAAYYRAAEVARAALTEGEPE